MTAHLRKSGITLFGYHTTPKKVSIETDKFKAITSDKLENIAPEKVYDAIEEVKKSSTDTSYDLMLIEHTKDLLERVQQVEKPILRKKMRKVKDTRKI